ncbi:RNA-directed DNA polymerase from transposon X-partial [Lentinula edodes]|uniref:RNA-directed DNA polymerase from transposon X-partial n=1 Tax=Lentinula edodes TaxID=5353 RepID=A0A1Q3EAZ8_LENED|nr:RNA-directed DNA polymerase from transposon X-partial [Lentinula edodes]
MNPPDPLLSSFDPARIVAEDARANAIPLPSPPASHPAFNEPLSLDDISTVKAYLKRTTHSNSTGVDLATYDLLVDIDNKQLLPLFQRAIECRDIPSSWLTSTIIALAKPGKDSTKTSSYRAIALESCVPKICLTTGPPQIMSGPPTIQHHPALSKRLLRGVSHQ